MPETVNLVDRTTGQTFGVPADQVAAYTAQGFRPESDEESIDRTAAETFHAEHGGAAGAVGSAVAGGLSGLTLGLSDQALGGLGAGRMLRHLEAEHPYATGGGTVAGALLPTVLTGGAAAGEEAAGIGARILAHSPAGLVGRGGRAIGGLGEGAGLLGRVTAGTAGAAAEGAAYGGGQYLTETALEDKPLSAEGFVAGMGHGALFAAPIGAGATLASATLQRARSLFPRSEVNAAAAGGIKQQATSSLSQAVSDGDQMAAAAERKLSDVEAKAQMAQAGEHVTRRVFGAADPQALGDQVAGAVDRQQVTQALQGYQQARGRFEEWIATEADPEFAAAMGKLDANQPALDRMLAGADRGDLDTLLSQVGGGAPHDEQLARAMRGTLAEPDVLGAGGVPVGEFDVLASSRAPKATPATTGDITLSKVPRQPQDVTPPSMDLTSPFKLEDGPMRFDPERRQYFNMSVPAEPMGGVPAQEIVQRGMAEQPATAVGKRPGAAAVPREIGTADEFRAMQRDLREKLTPDEIKQSLRFSRENYLDVNRALRGDRPPLDPEAASQITPVMDRIIDKSVIDHPIVTHRAIHFDPGEANYNLKPGDVFYDPGFGPTARSADKIHRFGNIHIEITSPAGTRIAAIPSSAAEGELTLARGTSLKITDRMQQPDGKVRLRATVIKQDAYGPIGEAQPAVPAASDRMRADLTGRARISGRYDKGAAPLPEGEVPEHGALSKYLDRTGKDYADQTLPARAIGERGYFEPPGGGTDAVRVENARKAIAEGQREGIKLGISPEGKILVTDGRHRLAAAIEADAPIKVRWTTSTEPTTEDVFRAGAKAAEPADDLLAALSGTKAALGRGESFTGVGRAPSAAARAEQLLRHPETAERFMAKAGAADAAQHLRGKALAARAAEEPEVGDATMGRILAKHGLEMAEPAATAPEVGDATMKRILAEHGLGEPPRAPAAAAEPDALAARILRNESRPSAIAPTAPVSDAAVAGDGKLALPTNQELRDQAKRWRAESQEQRAAKAIMRHNGKNVDIGPNLARAARAIGDLEHANATLVDVLGTEAPATAAENAKAYRAALRQQQERSAASAAKTAADLKSKLPAADATAVDDKIAVALRQHDARAAARAPAAAVPTPATAASTTASKLGGIADIGSALEVLKALGVHTPAISAIPVIGPVLGLFFKARAVMSILGRKGGSIGKSTEGLIASKAAAVQDRIAAATDGILAGAAKGAKAASFAAGPAALLAGKLFPGGEDPKSKDPRVLYAARMDELARAQAPNAIDHAVGDRYQTSDPALHDALVAQVARGIQFLASKAPKQIVLPGVLPGDGTWRPSMAALDEFGKYVHAVNDPVSVLEDLARGHVNMEGAETLRVVYPKLYAVAQRMLLEAAPAMQATLPYPRRVTISILYGIPVDGTMAPSHMQYLRGPPEVPGMGAGGPGPAPGPAGPPAAPAIAGPLKLGPQTMSPLDRRAGV